MVQEVKDKNIFQIAKNSAREIGYKTVGAFAFLGIFAVVITVTFILSQQRQTVIQNAAYDAATRTFTENFDGHPSFPEPFNDPNWDVQIHSRDQATFYQLEPMSAQHGMDCSAPPAVHQMSGNYADAVFNCKDHVMTSIHAGGYGLIALTPNAMLDFSNGGSLSFDVSTERPSGRDWIDVWITPYNENVALPYDAGDVDLEGTPKTAIHIDNQRGQNSFTVVEFKNWLGTDLNAPWWIPMDTGIAPGTNEAATRQTFKITISRTHLKLEHPASPTMPAFVFLDTDMPDIGFSQGVVQFAQHDYNPSKDGACNDVAPDGTCETTWHWDNVIITPAVPFTIIKTSQRFADPSNTSITFNSPAPVNANLRFAGVGTIQVSYDGGKTWQTAQKQITSGIAGVGATGYHAEHQSSYWTPIPAGTQTVRFQFSPDSWYTGPFIAQDFSIWSQDTANVTPNPTQPVTTPTPIPTATSVPSSPTPSVTSTPTLTPTPTPTRTPTPVPPTATNSPSPLPSATPTPTKSLHQKADFNGNGIVDIQDLGYLLSVYGKPDITADINGSGLVDLSDLSILLSFYNQ